jgi:predicted O-methyltransferase YrrM
VNITELASLYEGSEPTFSHPVFDRFEDVTRMYASIAASRLMLCNAMGFYDPRVPKRIVDFGAGRGGSTLALALLAEQNGGTVEALEVEPSRFKELEQSGLTQAMPVQAHMVDGIDWLIDQAQQGEQFDLIAGCMLGPDFEGSLTKELLDISRTTLVPGGKLIVYSDKLTMKAARAACSEAATDYQLASGLIPGVSIVPDALVVTAV